MHHSRAPLSGTPDPEELIDNASDSIMSGYLRRRITKAERDAMAASKAAAAARGLKTSAITEAEIQQENTRDLAQNLRKMSVLNGRVLSILKKARVVDRQLQKKKHATAKTTHQSSGISPPASREQSTLTSGGLTDHPLTQEAGLSGVVAVGDTSIRAQPSVEVAKPSVGPAKPSVGPAQPSVEPVQQSVEPAQHSVEPVQPSVEHVRPSVAPGQPSLEHVRTPVNSDERSAHTDTRAPDSTPFAPTNKAGQSLRWSLNLEKLRDPDNAAAAIYKGKLDGESKQARRRRIRREKAVVRSWALVQPPTAAPSDATSQVDNNDDDDGNNDEIARGNSE